MKAITTALLVFLLSTVLHTGHCERSLLKDEMITLKGDVAQMKAELQTFKNASGELDQLKAELQTFKNVFGVWWSPRCSIPTTNLTAKQIIKFGGIVSNEGNGYDVGTGKFTAPLPGMYVFFVQITNHDANLNVYLDIMKNSKFLARSHAGFVRFETGATLVVTHLNEGDEIHVQISNGDRFYGSVYTAFSGIRISSK